MFESLRSLGVIEACTVVGLMVSLWSCIRSVIPGEERGDFGLVGWCIVRLLLLLVSIRVHNDYDDG